MIIPLPKIYQCKRCNAIIEEEKIEQTKTDDYHIKQCPVCGHNQFIKVELKG